MIPDFDPASGFLPVGKHSATWHEFEARYGYTEQRKELIKGLSNAVQDLRSCGCRLIYVDGSFITNKVRPKDIDVCWDKIGVDLDVLKRLHPVFFNLSNDRKLQKAKYLCEFFPADVKEGKTDKSFVDFFQKSKDDIPKGILIINIQYI